MRTENQIIGIALTSVSAGDLVTIRLGNVEKEECKMFGWGLGDKVDRLENELSLVRSETARANSRVNKLVMLLLKSLDAEELSRPVEWPNSYGYSTTYTRTIRDVLNEIDP